MFVYAANQTISIKKQAQQTEISCILISWVLLKYLFSLLLQKQFKR